jgi:hypothetical protein
MPTVLDLVQLQAKAEEIAKKFKAIVKWKGNDAPNTHHWDAGSIVPDAGVDAPSKKVWVKMAFKDGGVEHAIEGRMDWDKIGIPAGGDWIALDGVEMSGADFILSHREGLEGLSVYFRAILEFHFTDGAGNAHDYRFDGG